MCIDTSLHRARIQIRCVRSVMEAQIRSKPHTIQRLCTSRFAVFWITQCTSPVSQHRNIDSLRLYPWCGEMLVQTWTLNNVNTVQPSLHRKPIITHVQKNKNKNEKPSLPPEVRRINKWFWRVVYLRNAGRLLTKSLQICPRRTYRMCCSWKRLKTKKADSEEFEGCWGFFTDLY